MHPAHFNKLLRTILAEREKIATTGNHLHCHQLYGGNPCMGCGKQMPITYVPSHCSECLEQLNIDYHKSKRRAKAQALREIRAKLRARTPEQILADFINKPGES